MYVCVQSEDIVLDPDLRDACAEDVRMHCQRVTHGKSQVCFCSIGRNSYFCGFFSEGAFERLGKLPQGIQEP